MIFNNNEIDLIEWCLEQQSIDFNEIEEQDMTSILHKLRLQRQAITNTYVVIFYSSFRTIFF